MTQSICTPSLALMSPRHRPQTVIAATVDADRCARIVLESLLRYTVALHAIIIRAPGRFDQRDWQGSQCDSQEASQLQEQSFHQAAMRIESTYGALVRKPAFWREAKGQLAVLASGLCDAQLARGFFDAIACRLYQRARFGYVLDCCHRVPAQIRPDASVALRTIASVPSLDQTIEQLLHTLPLDTPWQDLRQSAAAIAQQILAALQPPQQLATLQSIEVMDTVFYRITSATVIGRINGSNWSMPLAISVQNTDEGLVVERLLLSEGSLAQLFFDAHANLQANINIDCLSGAVAYLQRLMPQLANNQLYAAIGHPYVNQRPD